MSAASRARRRTAGPPSAPNHTPWWLVAILLIIVGITIALVAVAFIGWKPILS
ncbi:MAG: hypothetical protein ACSLFI_00150 [Solirubrobacterales bacterium]